MDEDTKQPGVSLAEIANMPQGACLRGTIHVTRAETGKVDTFDIVLTPLPLDPQPQEK